MPSEADRERNLRVQDFERRASYAPASVLLHPNGWRYIPVHEFGEPHLDAYWSVGSDAYFFQAWAAGSDLATPAPGLYFRWSSGSPGLFNLVAVLGTAMIERHAVETAMSQFAALLPPSSRPDALTPLRGAAA